MAEGTVMGVVEVAIEHEHSHDGVEAAQGFRGHAPMGGSGGNGMGSGTAQSVGGFGVVGGGDAGLGTAEVVVTALEVVMCSTQRQTPYWWGGSDLAGSWVR